MRHWRTENEITNYDFEYINKLFEEVFEDVGANGSTSFCLSFNRTRFHHNVGQMSKAIDDGVSGETKQYQLSSALKRGNHDS